MKKRERVIIGAVCCAAAVALAVWLWNLAGQLWTSLGAIPEPTTAPSRMVQQIDIAIHPADSDFRRCYTSQENLTFMLHLLRDMTTTDIPQEDPDLDGGQSYYSVTVTYANGSVGVYHLLGYRFLQQNDGTWCHVDTQLVKEFSEYLRSHPDDGGVSPPPVQTQPTEPPTQPPSSEPAEETTEAPGE